MVGGLHALRAGQIVERDLIFLQPLPVRLPRRQLLLHLLVGDQALLLGIHQQHAAGREPALHAHFFRLHRKHAGFRGHDHQAAVGDQIAAGAQAVAVELGADDAAIGEGHVGGPIPRLHERGVIFVESLDVLGHGRIVLPSLGDQHGHHVRQAAARQRQQLHGVVEHRRIAAAGRDDGQELLDVVAEERRGQHGLPRVHPVDIAAQRIDLAVVADVAIGVRQLPARETYWSRSAGAPGTGRWSLPRPAAPCKSR